MEQSGQPQRTIDERVCKRHNCDGCEDASNYKLITPIIAEQETGKAALSMCKSAVRAELSQYAHTLFMADLIGPLVLGTLYSGRVHRIGVHVDMPNLDGRMRGECNGIVIG